MAAAMLASIPSKDELYDYAARAYDPESRVPLVEAVLNKVGVDKYLDEKQALTTYELAPNTRRSTVPVSLRPTHAGTLRRRVATQVEALATCTTAAGLVKEAPALLERAAPRLYEKGSGLFEKSKEKYEELVPVVAEYKEAVAARVTLAREGADGRAAVLAEGKELATERIVVPARAAAAPYIAKIADRKAALVEKKEALLADKRLARALDALHEAHAHRAWPTRTGPGPRAPGLAHGRPVDSDTTRVITEAGGVRGGGWGVGGAGGSARPRAPTFALSMRVGAPALRRAPTPSPRPRHFARRRATCCSTRSWSRSGARTGRAAAPHRE